MKEEIEELARDAAFLAKKLHVHLDNLKYNVEKDNFIEAHYCVSKSYDYISKLYEILDELTDKM